MCALKVLFVGMQWDYGDPQRGPSYEWTNFYDTLRHMEDVEATAFDFMATHRCGGPPAVAARVAQSG